MSASVRKLNTHQFLSIFRIVINDRLPVKEEEDTISRDLGLGIVGGEGRCLTDSKRAKDDDD